ncbi:BTB/POZ domain-containing protein 9 [Oopsacas minuta]|uniref:BTB/POZ domain-containing protein 9 n=1 Tax=Oopsacas minuta TaxID=111878 RepID=A0AAV7KBK7_9METZ|nr:BTB/POZ domain-containing protein 9 [Oopsacas minuta]
MDLNAKEVLNTEGFFSLSEPSLTELLSRDSFYADEVDIFNGVIEWLQFNGKTKESSQRVLRTVRLNLLDMKELLSRVRPSGFFCPDTILDAIEAKVNVDPLTLNRRGILIPDDNVARLQHAAEVTEGQQTQCLLDGNSENYNWDHGFTLHRIDPEKPEGITIKLGRPHIINTIRMLLFDRDYRSYSYVIQVSLDQEKWLKVVDYSSYYCRSWQELHFQARVVQYIRVIGTMNTHNRSFHLVAFECLYSTRPFILSPLFNGLIVPAENVASVAASATVIEGVSRSRNALLNGNIRDYDWDSGYTCHQLGSGSIVIQLAQPYVIESMR